MMKLLLLAALLLSSVHCAVWKILVGGEGDADPKFGVSPVQFFYFYPNTLTVNQGDSVVFQWGGPMAYTVTFASAAPSLILGPDSQGRLYFNPQLAFPTSGVIASTSAIYSSGVAFWAKEMGPAPAAYPSWNTTFPNVGTFPFWSVFVNGMAGSITVQPAGSAYPTTQAALDAATQAQISAQKLWWPAAKQFYKLDRTVPFSKPHPNGVNTIWSVWAGYGDFWNKYGVNLFFPSTINVKVGDVIVFNNADIGAHTIGFNGTDGQFTWDINFDPVTGELYFNPVWSYPTFNPHTGGFVTGGLMLPPIVPGNTGWTWNVTVTKAGSFPVICSLHDDFGMVGTINVT